VTLTDHLSARQVQTLAALVDTIVPADDYPSGTEAGVLDHLDRQFGTDLTAAVAGYRAGLDALDAESHAVHGRPFAALVPEQRERLLWTVDPRGFLADAVTHVMEGFYRTGVAWEMVGFEVTG
jgi:gluconate 2-dehydrogenase gamma chain